MNVCARIGGAVGVFAVAAILSAVGGSAVAASTTVSAARVPTAVTDGTNRALAYSVWDDTDIVHVTSGWSPVSSGSAYRDTLTCASGKGQTLRIRDVAEADGDIRVQTGPGRGSVKVIVSGSVVARASTASATTGYERIPFGGAGRVKIRVSSSGKTVCVDRARLILPNVIPGG